MPVDRHVTVKCSGASAELMLLRMVGGDELGRLSEYRLDLLCLSGGLTPGEMLGQDLSVELTLPSGPTREFNGIVTMFRMSSAGKGIYGSMSRYEAIVRPRLWLLTRGSHYRFFHEMTVTDIVKTVLDEYQVDMVNRCTTTYPKREHCAQYRETDFAFVSRLMEHEGIYYYFEHESGKHTMVLADSGDVHTPISHYDAIAYDPAETPWKERECIYHWRLGGELQTGFYETNDYDFQKPSASLHQGLKSRATRTQPYDPASYTGQEHLSGYTEASEGDRYARVGAEIHQSRNEIVEGRSTARGVWPGGLFRLNGHPSDAQNDSYLVVSASYEINSDTYVSTFAAGAQPALFDCAFTALRKSNQFRSARTTPRAVASGPQTAVVVGESGAEITTDSYGRIKVAFHWEQLMPASPTKSDMNRCWVRVAQGWAGNQWGAFFLPRIGHEVLVEFIEGDPDQPVVTGSVYNASLMPPYKLPDDSAVSTIKSNSTTGGGGYNEVRFKDAKGNEQLFFHAQKDHETWVINDSLMNVGNDRHLKVKVDEHVSVGGNRHDHVVGNQNAQVDGNASLTVKGDQQEQVSGNYALSVTGNIHLAASGSIVIEAQTGITLKVGGAFVVIEPGPVSVQGTPIQLNSGGSAGSGAGASPTAPVDPTDADDGTKKVDS
ncbi:type VI secretion system Vgr family protein [Paraburkholderia unamae]|uniref:type VI secretion system Vgr family protein n=1 Tax=Paraburkholderia unamae TaxID=219649 RepID=UPI000DD439A8|nr:type VI secretion system tip protein TssI/VgrG [Paraburkholderia unamae]